LVVLTLGLAGSNCFQSTTHVAVLHSTMIGANEVPGPGDPNASGSTIVVLNSTTGQVCYVIKVMDISLPLTRGHIHIGAAGVAGPVVIPFPLTGGRNTFAGCTTASKTLIQQIIDNPSGYYTNVHNAPFPGGAIRGQLSSLTP
jgi:CHRD domain